MKRRGRTLHESRQRGFFGILFKFGFVIFNILMILWVFGSIGVIEDAFLSMTSDAERAGGIIGAAIGIGGLLLFWLVGSVVLGFLTLLTRGRVTYVEVENDLEEKNDWDGTSDRITVETRWFIGGAIFLAFLVVALLRTFPTV